MCTSAQRVSKLLGWTRQRTPRGPLSETVRPRWHVRVADLNTSKTCGFKEETPFVTVAEGGHGMVQSRYPSKSRP